MRKPAIGYILSNNGAKLVKTFLSAKLFVKKLQNLTICRGGGSRSRPCGKLGMGILYKVKRKVMKN